MKIYLTDCGRAFKALGRNYIIDTDKILSIRELNMINSYYSGNVEIVLPGVKIWLHCGYNKFLKWLEENNKKEEVECNFEARIH